MASTYAHRSPGTTAPSAPISRAPAYGRALQGAISLGRHTRAALSQRLSGPGHCAGHPHPGGAVDFLPPGAAAVRVDHSHQIGTARSAMRSCGPSPGLR